MKLRPYQAAARAAIIESLGTVRATLLVMPTGTGKTRTFGSVAQYADKAGMRVLVLAHRRELLKQAAATFGDVYGLATALDVAEMRADPQGTAHVMGSVQSLQRKRLAAYPRDAFDLVIVDEAHHAIAKTYRTILAHFASAKVLGVTATPDRGDGVKMRTVFEEVAFTYSIKEAIRAGYLVPIKPRRIVVDGLDLKSVKLKGRGGKRGAFDERDLSRVLRVDEALHGMAQPIVELAGERSTLVFCADVAHAHAMAAIIERYAGPGTAMALDGSATEEERAEVIARFKAGDLQFLCNCMLFLEGFDAPRTGCVAMARPWKVRAPYVQAVGRGTRLHPDSGKVDVLVLDFVGNSSDHSLICPADILEGRELDERERKAVARVLEDDPDLDIVEALSLADEQLRAQITVKARYKVFDVDPFAALDIERPREDPEWSKPATAAQLATRSLQALGPAAEGLTRDQASALIGAIGERARAGLPTYKQARVLAKHKVDLAGVTREEAGRLITLIKENGWRWPAGAEVRRTAADDQPTKPRDAADAYGRGDGYAAHR